MKIVAIRGANLASLAGSFELRLDAPPFYGSGVFAICGPTGAGKSTLLDAMCLALFDRTPRLVGRSQVKVGDDPAQQIGEYDVRGILRRGCAEGYAEVDFDSDDGLRYRARWQVRRARNRADGQLQNQELSLVRLPAMTQRQRASTHGWPRNSTLAYRGAQRHAQFTAAHARARRCKLQNRARASAHEL